jgi:hypothetical protein
MGKINQRGITTRSPQDGGEQERDLVTKYRGFAERCKVCWPRTSLVLRRIADRFELQARQHDERADGRV